MPAFFADVIAEVKSVQESSQTEKKKIIRKCHVCGQVTESAKELERCPACSKAFLPLNYFAKVHAKNTQEFQHLFSDSEELHEDDLVLGIYVLW